MSVDRCTRYIDSQASGCCALVVPNVQKAGCLHIPSHDLMKIQSFLHLLKQTRRFYVVCKINSCLLMFGNFIDPESRTADPICAVETENVMGAGKSRDYF